MLRTAHAALAAAILYCLAVLLGVFPARAANVPCGPWEAMLRALYERHGELPTYIATTSSGVVLTVVINPATGSFTVLSQSNPDVMCMVSVGENWREAPEGVRKAPTIKPGKES